MIIKFSWNFGIFYLEIFMITRQAVNSCCGSKGFLFLLDKPIRKPQMKIFQDAAYLVPDLYLNAGLFYVQKEFMIATGSFGSTKISIKCNGAKCAELLDQFQILLEKAINS
jgi:hypothetical protein